MWKAVRYSGVGVFLAGIISTITSCTSSEQIGAILLLLAMLLGGGGEGSQISIAGGSGTGVAGTVGQPLTFSVPHDFLPHNSINNTPQPLGHSDATCVWDMGDGTILTGTPFVSYAYTTAGSYTVTVTCTNSDGQSNTGSIEINIGTPSSPPAPGFTLPDCLVDTCIDPFSVASSHTNSCTRNTSELLSIVSPVTNVSLRIPSWWALNTGTGDVEVTVDNTDNSLTIGVSGGSCDLQDTAVNDALNPSIIYWGSPISVFPVDFTVFNTIRLPIVSVTGGPITDCVLEFTRFGISPAGPINVFDSASFAITTGSTNIDVDISGLAVTDATSVGLSHCSFPAGSNVVFGPIVGIP